jgi:hypothetical protein
MAGEQVTILDVRRMPSPDPARYGKTDAFVTYELLPNHRASIRLPNETLSEATIREAVTRDLKEHSQWRGKTLKL